MSAVLSWQASPSENVQQYSVVWNYNGVPQTPVVVPVSGAAYSLTYAGTLNPNDILSASVSSVDTVNHLTSVPAVSNTVTVPVPPPTAPLPPTGVTLVLQ